MDVDVFQVSLDSINQQLKKLEHTSNNVANLNTPGYVATESFTTLVEGKLTQQVALNTGSVGIQSTNRALDIAINGNGFFQLEHNGEMKVSKYGRFHINSDGYLAHSSGALLQGNSGPIAVLAGKTTFNTDGSVVVDGEIVDQISLLAFADARMLKSEGKHLFAVLGSNFESVSQTLSSGALNQSNVDASKEMINMMELGRTITSGQKVIQAYDQLLNIGINELGKR